MSADASRTSPLLAALRRDRTAAVDRMATLAATARGRSMTDDEQHDFDAAHREVDALDEQIAAAEAAGGDDVEQPSPSPSAAGTTVGRAEAAEIAKLCADGGVPGMAATLLADGVSLEEARARIGMVARVESMVSLARGLSASIPEDFAATMLAQGKGVEQIRAALFDKMVAAEEKTSITSHKPATGDAARGAPKPVDLVADMKRRHGVKA